MALCGFIHVGMGDSIECLNLFETPWADVLMRLLLRRVNGGMLASVMSGAASGDALRNAVEVFVPAAQVVVVKAETHLGDMLVGWS